MASRSPRRASLLKELGLKFEIHDNDNIDEGFPPHLQRGDIADYLAKIKSRAFNSQLGDNDILITADTIVWHNDHLLGKPESRRHAYEILRELSGNLHEVYTGVCLRSKLTEHSFVSETSVRFSDLTDDEINFYIENYQPFDKAGAYGIQEWIGYIAVEEIRGSYFNVMGLPVQRLYQELLVFTEGVSTA